MIRNTLIYNTFRIIRIQCNKYCLSTAQPNFRQNVTQSVSNINNVPGTKDVNYILRILNKSDEIQLGKYVSEEYATELYNYRKTNGPYKSIQDLSSVKNINDITVKELCKTLLDERQKVKTKNLRKQLFIPRLPEKLFENVNTLLGVHMGNNIVSWALIDREYNLLEWNYRSFLSLSQSANIFKISEFADDICPQLPKADLYITNENSVSLHHKNRQYFVDIVQQQQLTAFIFGYLNRLCNNKSLPRLHVMRSAIMNQYYNLEIGHEIISTRNIIRSILNTDDGSASNDYLPHLKICNRLKRLYEQNSVITKEQMNWSLLMPLTCLKLLIHLKTSSKSNKV